MGGARLTFQGALRRGWRDEKKYSSRFQQNILPCDCLQVEQTEAQDVTESEANQLSSH
jgi:hypothetical protein